MISLSAFHPVRAPAAVRMAWRFAFRGLES